MRLAIAAFAAASLAAATSFAAISYNVVGSVYFENFDTLAQPTAPATTTSGIAWANNSTLPGWSLFRVPAPGTAFTAYGATDGSTIFGDFYSFGSSGSPERALGGIGTAGAVFGRVPSGNVAGYWGVQITNNSPSDLYLGVVTFDVEQWRHGGAFTPLVSVAQPLVVEWAINPTDWFAGFNPGSSTNSPVFGTSAASALDGNLPANRVAGVSFTIPGPILIGETLWVRFREFEDVAADHGLAIDNFSFTAIPEPASLGLLGVAGLALARRRR